MRTKLFDRGTSKILILIFLVIVIAVSVLLIQNGIYYIGKATPDPTPQKVRITNVTDTSFTVVYTTIGLYEGVISLTNGDDNRIFLDDRDRSSWVKEKYHSHHITALNLSPNTSYTFKIISGSKDYEEDSYAATTGSTISNPPPPQNPLYGTVIHKDGSPGSDSVVFAEHDSSLTVSAFTNSRGEFIIPTNSMRNKANDNYTILSDDSVFQIQAINKDSISSVSSNFKLAQNLPTISFHRSYELTEQIEQNELLPPVFEIEVEKPLSPLSILTEKDTVITKIPYEFTGTASPGRSVTIQIDDLKTSDVFSDLSGSWSYILDSDLNPGTHRIAVSSENEEGELITVASSFVTSQNNLIPSDQLLPTNSSAPTATNQPTDQRENPDSQLTTGGSIADFIIKSIFSLFE